MKSKTQLRAFGLKQRKELSEHQHQAFSQAIMMALFEHLSAMNIESVLSYRSMASEVATDAVLRHADLCVFTPVVQGDASMLWRELGADTGWLPGAFDVLEPDRGDAWMAGQTASVLLCPLTAFDRQGNRLGMGKGYFDRWLSRYHQHVEQVIGLAFSCQEVAEVPAERHDMAMDYVITENEVIACTSH